MENRKNQTGGTYIHRLQDGTEAVIGTDPAGRPQKGGTVSRLRAYRRGGRERCTGR